MTLNSMFSNFHISNCGSLIYIPQYIRNNTPKPSGGRAIGMYYKSLNGQRKKVKGSKAANERKKAWAQRVGVEQLKKEYQNEPGLLYANTQKKFKKALEQIRNYQYLLSNNTK